MFDERGIRRQKRVTSNQWLRLLILWLGASCMTHVRWRETTRIHSQRINENTRQVQDSQRHLMAAGCQSSVSVKIIQRPVFGDVVHWQNVVFRSIRRRLRLWLWLDRGSSWLAGWWGCTRQNGIRSSRLSWGIFLVKCYPTVACGLFSEPKSQARQRSTSLFRRIVSIPKMEQSINQDKVRIMPNHWRGN